MNDKLKSIIEEFRKEFVEFRPDFKSYIVEYKGDNRGDEVKDVEEWFTAKLTEYGASEREAGRKEHCEGNHKSSLCPNCVRAGREEAIREAVEKIEAIEDPYPIKVFPDPQKDFQKDLDTFAKTKGYRIDNISAYFARWARKILTEDIINDILSLQKTSKEEK